MPWETLPAPKQNGPTPRVWRHTVYLGVYEVEDTYEHLRRIFAEDEDVYDERASSQSACAAILIDSDGRMVEDAVVLSSTLWGVGRILDPEPLKPDWGDGFTTAQSTFASAVEKYVGSQREAQSTDEPPILGASALQHLKSVAQRVAGVDSSGELATDRIIIQSQAVPESHTGNIGDMDFLNSFFLDDLATVRRHAGQKDIGAALEQYLTGDEFLNTGDRIDVLQQPHVVNAQTGVHRLPKGRWPSKPQHGLALSQQFAVNEAVHELGSRFGMMGVNGPPGTGKTTMLRDILASNVVERARRLAALPKPQDAFSGQEYRWSDKHGYDRVVPALIPALTGFEMIVASANNGAVENITTEIPAADAIDALWRDTADYFGDIATDILQETVHETTEQEEMTAWGLVAARLGKKSNRSKFRSKLWFDRDDGQTTRPGLQMTLKQWATGQVSHRSWHEAQLCFYRVERRVDELIAVREQAQERIRQLDSLEQRQSILHASINDSHAAWKTVELQRAEASGAEQRALVARQAAEQSYDRRLRSKPGMLENFLSFGRSGRQWRQELAPHKSALDDAEQLHTAALRRRQSLTDQVETCKRDITQATASLTEVETQQREVEAQCIRDSKRYGKGYPGPDWTGDQRELHAPWLDEELDTARSELFLAALQLHQDFFANAADKMAHGLRAAVDVVAGDYPAKLEPEKLRAAWQLFFLLVPLVSTTFASFPRMFGNVGKEAFGWLLIDEAGQAAPQQAAGAIWRSQRVVAVGDPLQLQPVVTIPKKLLGNIAATYDISATWIPPGSSVQTLADRITKYGTTLPQGDTDMWVSAPLRVHRRCHNPMFELSNTIAYDGMMVHGVPPVSGNKHEAELFDGCAGDPRIAWSYWADEPAATPGTHLQANEITRFEKALEYFAERGLATSDVIAISPFRDVADKLRSVAARYPGLTAGTIHTAQGKEAAVVVLVLGGDPSSPGAKTWAASTVNLVNVAVSRAQRRLYVIGDRRQWAQHNYFRQLSAALK